MTNPNTATPLRQLERMRGAHPVTTVPCRRAELNREEEV